jgi:hypothetical protein
MRSSRVGGWDLTDCGWDLAERLERLAVNKVAIVMGSITKKQKNPPLKNYADERVELVTRYTCPLYSLLHVSLHKPLGFSLPTTLRFTDIECTATKIPFMYSQKSNCAVSVIISTFTCLWTIYIFLGSVYIFSYSRICRPIVGYIYRSQTHKCGNWDWGRAIPFLGIFV